MVYDHNNFIYYCIIFGIEMGQNGGGSLFYLIGTPWKETEISEGSPPYLLFYNGLIKRPKTVAMRSSYLGIFAEELRKYYARFIT